ncbi:TPA: hypothetical protein N0F65_010443 [Lagenidium giganteum]|uniref:peptidylprolyl isomerase n=1 Tax=Lagenidium giganteum TaxID=4803 RepID=A0AAV2YSZ8_9STRA|nr:TPA: hypothetical protein N0F65_010443 [Lagenidium giganteum]
MPAGDLIISGDCGGTNTRLSLWVVPYSTKEFKGNVAPGSIIFAKKYHNESHSSFSEVCHLFMKEANLNGRVPTACVLACAGPILNNTVEFTNIQFGWKIDGACLERELGIKTVKLINDFAAMGYGLLTLKPHEYIPLNDVPKEEGAPIATIGAGTGLGECYLAAGADNKYSCFACEGGHTDFAPADALEIEIYNYMKKELGCPKRLSVERIVSGPGLASIYDFLAKKFPERVNPEVHADFEKAKSLQGMVVGVNAKTDSLCNQAMEIFVGAYGREAGNAILKYLPRGGFYITGGLAPKNLDYFTKKDIFLDAVFDKGRVSPAVKAVPIYLVLTEDLGERGAHYYAYQLLKSYNESHGVASTISTELSTKHIALYSIIAAIGALVGAAIGMARARHVLIPARGTAELTHARQRATGRASISSMALRATSTKISEGMAKRAMIGMAATAPLCTVGTMGFCSASAPPTGDNGIIAVGDRIYIHMQGRLSNGKEFGKTEQDRPMSFVVGSGEVLRGIEEAVVGMAKGDSKSAEIEPAKAFGASKQVYPIPRKEIKLSPDEEAMLKVGNHLQLANGQPARIISVTEDTVEIDLAHELAGETLFVELTIVDRIAGSELSPAEQLVLPETITPGDNKTFPARGDTLVMHYTGKLASNGEVFDSSVTRGQPFQFTIGVGQVIQGWDEGVMRMSKGQKAILNIPAVKGYGRSGAGGVIPPNADLIFEVELLDILRQ